MIYRLLQQTLPQRFSKKSFLKALTVWLHPYPLILDARGDWGKAVCRRAGSGRTRDEARARRAALGSATKPLSQGQRSMAWIQLDQDIPEVFTP